MSTKKISLQAFIHAYGQNKLARDLGITTQAIYHWEKGTHVPTPIKALQIIKLSNELLSFDSIYRPYAEIAIDAHNTLNEEG